MPPKKVKNVEDWNEEIRNDEAYRRAMGSCGEILWRASEGALHGGVLVRRVSIRFPDDEHGDCLVTVAAYDSDGVPMVCFTSGKYADDALKAAMATVENNTAKWKEDKYG